MTTAEYSRLEQSEEKTQGLMGKRAPYFPGLDMVWRTIVQQHAKW